MAQDANPPLVAVAPHMSTRFVLAAPPLLMSGKVVEDGQSLCRRPRSSQLEISSLAVAAI